MSNTTTGFVIGRFQPFHKGHKYLIFKALDRVDKLIIGIGSSNMRDEQNPFSVEERKRMIEIFLQREDVKDKIIRIVSLPDVPDDDEWFRNTMRHVNTPITVIGNNDWVNGIFQRHTIPVIQVPYYKRYILEGQKIRKLLKKGMLWEDRVPNYLVAEIKRNYHAL